MKKILQKNRLAIAGSLLGAVGGYFYWKYVGCLSGTCLISSRPLNSTIYWGIMGGLVFSMIPGKSQTHSKHSGKQEL